MNILANINALQQ